MPTRPREVSRRTVVLGLLAVTGLAGIPAAAQQTPQDPGSVAARLAELDAATLALGDQITAAQQTLDERRAALAEAVRVADAADATAAQAQTAADTEAANVDALVSAAYAGARTSRLSAVLVSDSPQDLLDRMTALDLLGEDGAERLAAAQAARDEATRVATEATAAREAAAAAEQEAVQVQQDVVARRAELETQTTEARALLAQLSAEQSVTATPEGAAQLAASQTADTARASRATAVRSSLYAQPTVGRFTSGYGSRGGGFHAGIDLANSVGTPIWSVADGTVVDAGPASGFGQWVRVQHDDGTISVYGHVESFTVRTGAVVGAGQQIATMGNRGQSTGPHLHLEIYPGGGGSSVDPRSWLAERGITV